MSVGRHATAAAAAGRVVGWGAGWLGGVRWGAGEGHRAGGSD